MNNDEINPQNTKNDTGKDRLKSIIILGVLLLVILTGIFLIFRLKAPDTNYEILFQDTSKGQLTLQVFTKDTSESNLIAVNDDILKTYNDTTKTKFIFYFDNKEHTGKFFELFTRPKLNPAEQDEMSHNNAMYYFEKGMSTRPCLTKRLSQGWKIMKCY